MDRRTSGCRFPLSIEILRPQRAARRQAEGAQHNLASMGDLDSRTLGRRGSGGALLIDSLEIHGGEQHRRKSGASDEVRYGFARVGEQDVRTNDAEHRREVRLGNVADLKNARLRRLHQEQGLVAGFCCDRDDQGHLEKNIANALRFLRDLYLELRRLLLHERLRAAGHLEGQVLHVDFLNAKTRLLRIAHRSPVRIEISASKKSLSLEQGGELASVLQRGEVLEPAHVRVADIDLRHGTAARFLRHLLAQPRVKIYAHFFDLGDSLRIQELLRPHAEGAHGSRIHSNSRHSLLQAHFSRGNPACRQAPIPPFNENTCPKPILRSVVTAFSERFPLSHTTITGLPLYFSMSVERAARSPSARWRALSTCPFSYSAASRTSSTRAFCWLINRVA